MPQMNFGFNLGNGSNHQKSSNNNHNLESKSQESTSHHSTTQNNSNNENKNSIYPKEQNNTNNNQSDLRQGKPSSSMNRGHNPEGNNKNQSQTDKPATNNGIMRDKQNESQPTNSDTNYSDGQNDSKSSNNCESEESLSDTAKPNNDEEMDKNGKDSNHPKDGNHDLKQGNENESNQEKLDKLTALRDKLLQYKQKKEADEAKAKLEKSKLNNEKQEVKKSEEKKYELSEQTNNFINELKDLPSYEERDRGAGYSIDTESYTEVPDTVIKTLIIKFLNQRFCKKNTDLNIRSNSLEKSKGFYKWEVKDVITHLETHQVTKVLTDKYGYQYAEGKNENVPLSFYFDMSGSMSSFTNMLAIIAIELLKKKVKVLIGFNERVNVQIESIDGTIDVATLAKVLSSAGYSLWGKDDFIKDSRVTFKYIDKNIDNYLIEKKAEKCVIFSDFDPKDEVINLSMKAEVYWFCFEDYFTKENLGEYNGFVYKVKTINDIAAGLVKVSQNRFNTLCYTDNPEGLRKIRSKK